MSKIKIIVNPEDPVSFCHGYLRPVIQQYFDIVDYVPGMQVTGHNCLVMTQAAQTHDWYTHLVDSGAKLVYDAFWEYHATDLYIEKYQNSGLVASCSTYFWINEHYLNLSKRWNSYTPEHDPVRTHRALLPIRQSKPHRRQLLTALRPWLDTIMYSSVDQGRFLPNDVPDTQGDFQRNFNPEWYNQTYFSIVSETTTYTKYRLHVTEKTFKPISFFHPFVIFGQPGTLSYLHELGFETFENLFDETYDANPDQNSRLRQVVDNIVYFLERDYDRLTWDKMAHNNALFYNTARMLTMLVNDIIAPIIQYAETR